MTGCRCPECSPDAPPPVDPRRLAELTRERPQPAPKNDDKAPKTKGR